MKKTYTYLTLILISFSLALYQWGSSLNQKACLYASKTIEQKFGAASLSIEQEKKIKAIAHKIGVFEPIIIRKMNHKALKTFGYHNVIAYFPALFNFIPIESPPFLFVSEGFFEDLSPEEQLFLIGHEMVHIKERHTRYLRLVYYLLIFGLLLSGWMLSKISKFFSGPFSRAAFVAMVLIIPNLAWYTDAI